MWNRNIWLQKYNYIRKIASIPYIQVLIRKHRNTWWNSNLKVKAVNEPVAIWGVPWVDIISKCVMNPLSDWILKECHVRSTEVAGTVPSKYGECTVDGEWLAANSSHQGLSQNRRYPKTATNKKRQMRSKTNVNHGSWWGWQVCSSYHLPALGFWTIWAKH